MSQYNQTWANSHSSATNDRPAPPRPPTTQQNGAFPPQHQPRSADTVNSAIHRPSHPTRNATSHDHIRSHQPPVVSPTVSRPTEDLTHSRQDQHPPASDHQQWALAGDGRSGGHFPPSSGQPPIYNNMASSGRRPTNGPPDASHKKCRIPDCAYNAYYDFSEQEQTEYCGQGHELQAVSTGLVASCVMCKGRPRRTGERVCGRTCRERESQAPQVQGSYYGVPVVRRESRARPA